MSWSELKDDDADSGLSEEFCCLCDVSLRDEAAYNEHLEGAEHLSKLNEGKLISSKMLNFLSAFTARFSPQSRHFCCSDVSSFDQLAHHLTCPSTCKVQHSVSQNAINSQQSWESVVEAVESKESFDSSPSDVKRKRPIEKNEEELESGVCSEKMSKRDTESFSKDNSNNVDIQLNATGSVKERDVQKREAVYSFYVPTKCDERERVLVRNSSLERNCNFFIYQCTSCVTLLHDQEGLKQHLQSERHVEASSSSPRGNQAELFCLPCGKHFLLSSNHKYSRAHYDTVRSMANSPRKCALELLRVLADLQHRNSELQPTMTSLRSFTSVLNIKMDKICLLAKLVVMFSKEVDMTEDFCVRDLQSELELIPQLRQFWERACQGLLPYFSLKKFKGLFLCGVCRGVFSNLYTFLSHSWTSVNHWIHSAFHSSTSFCLSCPSLHRLRNHNTVSSALRDCITVEQPDLNPNRGSQPDQNVLLCVNGVKLHELKGQFDCVSRGKSFPDMLQLHQPLTS